MQINSLPLLSSGEVPDAQTPTQGGALKVTTTGTTFASAFAQMLGDIPEDAGPTEPEGSVVVAVSEESDSTEVAEGFDEDENDAAPLIFEANTPASKPETEDKEQVFMSLDPAEQLGDSAQTMDRSDEPQEGAVDVHYTPRGETATSGAPKRDATLIARERDRHAGEVGATADYDAVQVHDAVVETRDISGTSSLQGDALSSGPTQPATGTDRTPVLVQGAVAATSSLLAVGEMTLAQTNLTDQNGGRPPNTEGIFDELSGVRPAAVSAKSIAEQLTQVTKESLPGEGRKAELEAKTPAITASEAEYQFAARASVTAHSHGPQPQGQTANVQMSSATGTSSVFRATETLDVESFASVEEAPVWTTSRSVGTTGIMMPASFDVSIARPETVRNAAAYAVEVLTREPGKVVEIALNPEELGRVRMALSQSDAGVTVVITSERPETLELMRRHIEQLSQEFLKLGYEQASFEFDSEGSGGDDRSPKSGGARTDTTGDASETHHIMPARLIQTGLDLRL
ncbi:MAG: flagellar hook-length control protein FliK [Sedimentitalea sp.]|uniref:flagellar hook-length control protein FliK n=1 Tax=Sedimentitalea sp. TaxID=2048915 RepID=UPI003264653C